MKKSILSLSAIGLLAAGSAFGQAVPSTYGDLIVGFYATTGQGAGTAVMVNVGSFTNFLSGDGSSFSITGFDTADLVSTYGSNWYDRTGELSWGVIGSTKTTGVAFTGGTNPYGVDAFRDTLFASTLQDGQIKDVLADGAGSITPIYSYMSNSSLGAAGAGSATKIQTSASSTPGSFISQQDTQANSDFKFFADGSIMAGLLPGASGSSSLNVYEYVAADYANITPVSDSVFNLGQLTLTSSGLTFTSVNLAAVPEPSVYALLAGGLSVAFVAYRRRQRALKV